MGQGQIAVGEQLIKTGGLIWLLVSGKVFSCLVSNKSLHNFTVYCP